jgi:hypothetical protein
MSRPLVELLEDVLDNIEDATDGVADNASSLDLHDRALVEGHISTAISRIEEALRRLQGAGNVEGVAELASLEEIADRCIELAQEALEAHECADGSPDYIGGRLKTIQALITGPNGFATRAGLD